MNKHIEIFGKKDHHHFANSSTVTLIIYELLFVFKIKHRPQMNNIQLKLLKMKRINDNNTILRERHYPHVEVDFQSELFVWQKSG